MLVIMAPENVRVDCWCIHTLKKNDLGLKRSEETCPPINTVYLSITNTPKTNPKDIRGI